MDITVLETQDLKIRLKELMDKYDEYYWAVAWASSKTALADELFQRKSKIKQIVVGIDFDQTDPDFLNMMASVSSSRIAVYPSGGTFHPKVYYFQSQKYAAAIVGSANFTRGGTEHNVEVSILMEGRPDDNQLILLKNIVDELWIRGEKITNRFVDQYRERHKANRKIRESMEEKFVPKKEVEGENRKQIIGSSKLKALLADKELRSNRNSPLGYHAFEFAREQLAKYARIPDNESFIEYFQRDIVKRSFMKQPQPSVEQIRGRATKVRRKVRIACKNLDWSDEEIRLLNISPTGSLHTTRKSSLEALASRGYQHI